MREAHLEEVGLLSGESEHITAFEGRWRCRAAAKLILVGTLAFATVEVCWSGRSSPSLQAGMKSVLSLAQQSEEKSCYANEENFDGICYLQCRIATGGQATKRTAPATCCKSFSIVCFFLRSQTTTSDGLAIGGGAGWNAAPHIPGIGGECEANEEPFLGTCYAKCSTLTGNASATRTGPSSCCTGPPADCLAGKIVPTSKASFEAGGGTGEKRQPHAPDKAVQHSGDMGVNGDCQPQEEKFNGVCYQKCSMLTGGLLGHRKGPMTCCKDNAFFTSFFTCLVPSRVQTDAALSVGYSSSGLKVGPHPPGMSVKCLQDEERFAGLCYKSCSKLTNGTMPYRIEVTACCKFPLKRECGPDDILVSWQADTGGTNTNAMPHAPFLTPS